MSGAYTYEITIPKYMYECDKDWGIIHGDERFIECVMKVVCGFHLGSTMSHYMVELGLAESVDEFTEEGEVLTYLEATKKAKKFLYFWYNSNQARFIYEGKDE
jgi:hypothetical protein